MNGDFDLRKFPAAADLKADPHLLTKIIEAVRDGEMPPEGEGDLPPADRQAFVKQLDGIFAESLATRAAAGRPPVRRMNRFQYGNTVTDLLHLKIELFALPECIARDLSGYFQPETGTMPDQVKVGNRVLGKGQLKAPRLEDVVPFPQNPRAANGYDNRADLLALSPLLMESFLQLAESIFESPNFGPETCGTWKAMFEDPPATEPVNQAIAARLRPFLTQAFRRLLDQKTLDRYVAFATDRMKGGANFTDAMKAAAGAALASPRFLYLGDGATTGPAPETLDGYELASRLSFFLWASGPDDELLSAAGSGALRNPDVLAAQVDRMMNSRRMKRFCDAFGAQWLKIETLTSSEPDKKLFPDFHTFGIVSWAKRGSVHMMIEPLLVFETVFIENRSILDLIQSDFTYRTEHLRQFLAKAEKISPPIDGDNWSEVLVFDRVPVTTKRDGGVITTAAVMTMTSGPADTKPITRGKWIVETIFNDPPPPPPGNVPPIEKVAEAGKDQKPLTLREKFALHASSPACSACHSKIDPYGFALENYDPVGRWRDADGHGQPIDPSGKLFGRVAFATVEEFKDGLLAEKERVARAFAGHLLKYALGRVTNVATMMIAPERWDTTYLFDGVSDKPQSHHLLSHNGWSEELRKIDEFHVQRFASLLQKMDAIREADGSTLLDNTILTYGSGLGEASNHIYDKLPTIVAGSGGGKLKTGFHLECKPGTPLANLWLAQARAAGLELGEFADSTGVLDGILAG